MDHDNEAVRTAVALAGWIAGAVILATAFPFLIWKLTSHNGADHPAGNSVGHYLAKEKLAFVGYATPEDTFQSIARAMVDGDGDKVFSCLSPQDQAAIGNQPQRGSERSSERIPVPKQGNIL